MKANERAPAPLQPLTEKEIISNWRDDRVIVSILCATYNHEEYIEDAICGFLGQITSFPYEVIIRDDASNDKTVEVIKEYAKKYPRIIKPIYETINRYPLIKPTVVMRKEVNGKYIAYCEGDDYWIDPLKIQKQVEYLDSHPNTSQIETNSIAIKNGYIINWPGSGGTRTIMHRANITIPDEYAKYIYFGDTYQNNIMRCNGKVEKLADYTAVWRKHDGGVFGAMLDPNKYTELSFQRASTQFWIAIYNLENNSKNSGFHSFKSSINLLLEGYPETTYLLRLKLAMYITLDPARPLLGRLKRKLRSIT